MVPNVKTQRKQTVCEATLQAVGQRSQEILEVLDTMNETWTKIQGEKFVPSHLADNES